MFKHAILVLLSSLTCSCGYVASATTINEQTLIGTWAMVPAKNGIANVSEFRADGQATVHRFNCEDSSQETEIVTGRYNVDTIDDNIIITFPSEVIKPKILTLTDNSMRLRQTINFDESLDIDSIDVEIFYFRVNQIQPLCWMHTIFKALETEEDTLD